MITISLCMIVKNEEPVLARCLDSVASMMDEIIIVDTGSTDRTKEIAAQYTSRIYDFTWCDDFSAARNYAFSLATMDYICCPDADEYLDLENQRRFLRLKGALLPEIEIVQMNYITPPDFNTVQNCKKEPRPKLFKRLRTFSWVGSAIARELSRYKLKIGVFEKNLDVCNETSGRNSAVVHGGFAYDADTLKARFCVAGNRMMGDLSEELDFPFKRCGKVLVGNTEEDMEQLKRTLKQGDVNGATGLELIDEKKLHELVPAVVGKFAMWSKNSGIMDPFLFTIGLAENAAENGAKFLFGHEILGIERVDDDYLLRTGKGEYKAHWVINAAGLGCKTISDMLGITGYHVIGSKGNYIILDKRLGSLLPMPVYPVPSNTYMGIHVTPTVDGNVTVGPDAENVTDFSYYGVPQKNMEELAKSASNLWPHINKADQIRNFSGILPKWVDENGVIQDFKIEIKEDIAPHAVNLVGIESPGLTAAVPIAQYVVELMKEHERLVKNDQFIPEHKSIRRFATASFEEKNALIRENKEYGEIICSCEQVTKAEIRAAIRNPLGVATMTGVKYRTRAMMGTCQGGFCQMKIEQLIEEELGIPAKDVRYSRPDSWVLTGNMREEK